ncbi:hypothetical protein C5G87_17130 [Paenibacillus peoriae]|uniref:hypothetical protein n=1 Tax=Paenibacillus peoriae TaxID=59893 RepID=UPI000CECA364|nr:hypothetical protein [Paenibacillus peoriae]PPQ47837.1 hypothetical protein C5G87_17130 [Paenibacillus peoriae]
MITDNDQKQLLYKIYYFQEVMKSSYADANEAYEVLEKHEDDSKYYISLGYLAMSQQSFTELRRVYWENGLDHYEIESYFTAYESYVFQLKEVITDKDENTSWLYTEHEKLIEIWKSTNDFLTNWINNNIKKS